jgi:hypothetical protein
MWVLEIEPPTPLEKHPVPLKAKPSHQPQFIYSFIFNFLHYLFGVCVCVCKNVRVPWHTSEVRGQLSGVSSSLSVHHVGSGILNSGHLWTWWHLCRLRHLDVPHDPFIV